MATQLKSQLKLAQSLQLTQKMQQSLKLLSLNRDDLLQAVADELATNPCLVEGPPQTPSIDQQSFLEKLSSYLKPSVGEIQGQEYSHNSEEEGGGGAAAIDRLQNNNSSPSLAKHLRLQLQVMASAREAFEDENPDTQMFLIAESLVDELDDRGFLVKEVKELSLEFMCPEQTVQKALELIQSCEPCGVGARTYQECFSLQVGQQKEAPPLAKDLIEWHWALVEKQNYQKLAKVLHCSLEEVKSAIKWIGRVCDPRPARAFGLEVTTFVEPDVFVFKRAGNWIVSLNESGLPRLKLSKKYETLLEQMTDTSKEKQFITSKFGDARWFVKSLSERNKTILRVVECIIDQQNAFLEKGVLGLKPMTLKDVSGELGLHESTISRATSQKYVHTPRGLFEIKDFFSNGYSSQHSHQETSSQAVRNWVRTIIIAEPPQRPYSDQVVAHMLLEHHGVQVARRTVAKYRDELGIPNTSARLKAV